jgi:hypothetical protein
MLLVAAQALVKTAEECLYDVRDRHFKYETSPNCSALSVQAERYIEAGGFRDDTPDNVSLIAAQAKTTAWMARAISLAGNRPLRIW